MPNHERTVVVVAPTVETMENGGFMQATGTMP
jgi:hypothetical protein